MCPSGCPGHNPQWIQCLPRARYSDASVAWEGPYPHRVSTLKLRNPGEGPASGTQGTWLPFVSLPAQKYSHTGAQTPPEEVWSQPSACFFLTLPASISCVFLSLVTYQNHSGSLFQGLLVSLCLPISPSFGTYIRLYHCS